MTKSKATFEQLEVFRANAARYIEQFPKPTKLFFALEKMLERTKDASAKYQEMRAELQLDHAATDEQGCVMFAPVGNPGGQIYRYTKDGLKALTAALDKVFKKPNTVQIETYRVVELPEDLHVSYREVFSPFLIFEAVN